MKECDYRMEFQRCMVGIIPVNTIKVQVIIVQQYVPNATAKANKIFTKQN